MNLDPFRWETPDLQTTEDKVCFGVFMLLAFGLLVGFIVMGSS
jgi:hypothetical protein